eukprot:TRINITY_DN3296_c0_g1_i1.p1 TRINITY_DN3296_c0_g1~~TRINITY_DN3296_c0_g1_i1.p1  ORF type:complete len:236 (+),score=43.13 TRINITY_DN3296_c0_g1_i1:215-922(+)
MLDHPNIIKLREYFNEDNSATFYLILELLSGGSLYDGLIARQDANSYSEYDAAVLIKQILLGVEHMHAMGITHRDLKPENLLFNEARTIVKISDFGVSKAENQGNLKTTCGTPDHIAPEILTNEGEYSNAVDIWSFGVIAYTLLCGYHPFRAGNVVDLYNKILLAQYDFNSPEWRDVSSSGKHFISQLLRLDPVERLTATEALKHPWLRITKHRSVLSSVKENLQLTNSTNKKVN